MSAFADVRDNVDGSSHNVQRQRPEEDRRKRRNRERARCDQSRKGIINLFKFKKNIFKCKMDARGEEIKTKLKL